MALCMLGLKYAQTMVQFTLVSGGLGVSMGLAFTSTGAMIAEVVPADVRGAAMGGYNTFIYFGMMLSAGAMGGVIQLAGFGAGFSITFLVTAILTGGFAWFTRRFTLN